MKARNMPDMVGALRVRRMLRNGLGFKPCCGHSPIVTEWRPGCYGAECAVCGRILGSGRQVSRDELMTEWNNEQRKERT